MTVTCCSPENVLNFRHRYVWIEYFKRYGLLHSPTYLWDSEKCAVRKRPLYYDGVRKAPRNETSLIHRKTDWSQQSFMKIFIYKTRIWAKAIPVIISDHKFNGKTIIRILRNIPFPAKKDTHSSYITHTYVSRDLFAWYTPDNES